MAPSLSDSYSLVTLPRISDLKLSERIIVSSINSTNSSYIDVGISKSIISSYILKPSPKLVWSFPLPPSTLVDAMDVYEINEDSKLYIVGITDRRKHKVLLINKQGENSTNYEIKVEHKVKGLKFIQNSELIVVLYDNGSVELVENKQGSLTRSNNTLSCKGDVIYHSFISKDEFKSDDDLLLVIMKNGSNMVYKLIALNLLKVFEVNSFTTDESENVLFNYNCGYLYKLNFESKSISSSLISNFSVQKTISINSLIMDNKYEEISFISPSLDRLLLSVNDSLYLINFKFGSLLDTFKNPDKLFLNQLAKVKGNSLSSSKTFAVYLSLNLKENNVDLNFINVNVGLNKLNECLGMSIEKPSKEEFKGLSNLVNENFENESIKLSTELNEIYQALENLSKIRDLNKWERILIPYLKNESWESIKNSLNKLNKKVKIYQFQVFDAEDDRAIDLNFIEKILSLIFKFENDEVKLVDDDFLPEYTLIYLLTNPLFPYEYTRGLLKLFSDLNQVTLLRQSIITCPNLSIEDILLQFINLNNSQEIFEELLNRLTNEFSINEITKNFKVLIEKHGEIDLDSVLNSLVQIDNNNSWYLIQSIIDVGGLFNWSSNTVNKLNEIIELKLNSLLENSYNLTLTNQALLINEPIKKKSAKGKKKKTSNSQDIISASNQQQLQLDSILAINNNSSKKLLDGNDSSIGLSKRVPNYSVEKLML